MTRLLSVVPIVSMMTIVPPGAQSAGHAVAERVFFGSGALAITPANVAMLAIALVVLYLAVSRNYEPLVLVPVAFGMLVGNLPLPAWLVQVSSLVNEPALWGTSLAVVGVSVLPPLVFLGLGAALDLSSVLSRPRVALAGAAAQLGIFLAFIGAMRAGFVPESAAAIGLIGSADGPLAMFAAGRLAPALIVPVALAAYSFLMLAPLLQPLVARLLTTRGERLIKMTPGRPVSGAEAIACPIAGLLATALLVPGSLPLLGAFFLGNLLRASSVTSQLAKTAANTLLDVCTILLGVALGVSASAGVVLTTQTAQIFGLGIGAFVAATAAGILCVKVLNLIGSDPVNPLIGAAGVCALPGTARVVEAMGVAEDPANHLLPHTAGAGVAGLVGSALVAGLFFGLF